MRTILPVLVFALSCNAPQGRAQAFYKCKTATGTTIQHSPCSGSERHENLIGKRGQSEFYECSGPTGSTYQQTPCDGGESEDIERLTEQRRENNQKSINAAKSAKATANYEASEAGKIRIERQHKLSTMIACGAQSLTCSATTIQVNMLNSYMEDIESAFGRGSEQSLSGTSFHYYRIELQDGKCSFQVIYRPYYGPGERGNRASEVDYTCH